MNIEKLNLKHKAVISRHIAENHSRISEYSFANLYLFREVHDYRLLVNDDIYILGKTYDKKEYIMPLSPVTPETAKDLCRHMEEYPLCFPIEESTLSHFTSLNLHFSYHDGDSDYIYSRDKISHYPGRKLHKKRNLLKQFKEKYSFKEKVLSENNKADALTILSKWQEDIGAEENETDYAACKEAINLMETLDLTGCICYVDDEPGGFLLGEELSRNTFVIHFAKGRRKFKGLYQFMYSNFAKKLPDNIKYINFEQDLGKLSLKIAKSSYQPDLLLKKYRLQLPS
ncbi:MAG: DUF2156 domain-containing protein [Spirochaetes bacterium]|nr:DUF2156 domain-containing protein [Spirochaetota bacterium]